MEQGDLGAESWVALDCISDSIMLVNDEIICEHTVYFQILGEILIPNLYLFILLVVPVEARGCRVGASVQADLAVNLNLET